MKPEEIVFSEEDYKAVEKHIDDIAEIFPPRDYESLAHSFASNFRCYDARRSYSLIDFIPICKEIDLSTGIWKPISWKELGLEEEYVKPLGKLRDDIENAIKEITEPLIYKITFIGQDPNSGWRSEHYDKVVFIKVKKSEIDNAIKTLTKEVMEEKYWQMEKMKENGLPLYDVEKLDIREF